MNFPKLIASSMTLAITIFAGFGTTSVRSDQETTKPSSPANSGELRFKAPAEWVTEQPSSNMRVAQYKLPKAEGDSEDASLVLYFFGTNQGGSVEANLDRWKGQIETTDAEHNAKTETLDVNHLKVTTIDLVGTYTAETAPGSGVRHNKPGYRLRAAVIETPKGAYYVKLVGPTKAVTRWNKAFADYVRSFEFK